MWPELRLACRRRRLSRVCPPGLRPCQPMAGCSSAERPTCELQPSRWIMMSPLKAPPCICRRKASPVLPWFPTSRARPAGHSELETRFLCHARSLHALRNAKRASDQTHTLAHRVLHYSTNCDRGHQGSSFYRPQQIPQRLLSSSLPPAAPAVQPGLRVGFLLLLGERCWPTSRKLPIAAVDVRDHAGRRLAHSACRPQSTP